MAKATKIDLEVKKPYGNEHYEVGKFKGTGDAIISANALGKAAPSNYEYSVKATNKYAKGGHVSKGEMVWKKLSSSEKIKFLHENFTPEITPRSQETLVGKPYNFLPKNVKIKMEAKYANSENYANGGSLADTPESFPSTDAMSYKNGGGTWKVNDVSKAKHLGIIEFQDNEGEYHNFEVMETEDRLVFGGFSNSGFIESGYIEKDGFSTDEVLQELLSDLETYYNDGKEYTSMIVVNDRMAQGGSTKGFEYSIGGL